jgi:tRNA (guanosine-2'-O-)-methyltransferase
LKAERKEKMLNVLNKRQKDLVIVMENIEDPHNIGATMRTAESVGIQDIFVIDCNKSFKDFNKSRTTRSADKWVTLHNYYKINDCVNALKKRNLSLWATHLGSSAKSLYDLDLTTPTALVFGNERLGITKELLEHCDGNFIIPQIGMIQSLNVSVACAVTLYEAYRQRNEKNLFEMNSQSLFSKQEKQNIYSKWASEYKHADPYLE